ncbi:MAG: hypothetical protein MZV65_45880 [Chromatiales bacterium]|nr:hypothetical protein [Chromatiales bacterium]
MRNGEPVRVAFAELAADSGRNPDPMIRTAIQRPISTLVLILGLALFGVTNLTRLPVDFLPDSHLSADQALHRLDRRDAGRHRSQPRRSHRTPAGRRGWPRLSRLPAPSKGCTSSTSTSATAWTWTPPIRTRWPPSRARSAICRRTSSRRSSSRPIRRNCRWCRSPSSPSGMDLTQLRTWVDNWLTDRLLAAGGVAGVDVAGGLEREIRVLIDRVALEKYGLSLELIERRLQARRT